MHTRRCKFLVFLFAVQVLGAVCCLLVALPHLQESATESSVPGPVLTAIDLDLDLLTPRFGVSEDRFRAASNAWKQQRLKLEGDGFSRSVPFEELGFTILPPTAAPAAGYLAWPGKIPLQPDGETTVLIALHLDTCKGALAAIGRTVRREPTNARWDGVGQRVLGDVPGRRLDEVKSLARVHEAVVGGLSETTLEIEVTDPSPSREQLGDFRPDKLLGSFRTSFSRRDRKRRTNLSLAAQAIDGTILIPGGRLSYNETVGERSEARGFQMSKVIEQGEIVEGLGGGACQISSTLHAASLFAGLKLVERHSHSLPSSYIEMGLDSVVAWPLLDLVLENPYPFPVVLRVSLDDEGHAISEVLAQQEGKRVVMRKEIHEEIPFKEIVNLDEELEPETFSISKRGKVGYKVLRARSLWQGDKEEFERLPMDVYQPRAQQVRVGPGTIYPPPEEPLEGAVEGPAADTGAQEPPPDTLPLEP